MLLLLVTSHPVGRDLPDLRGDSIQAR